MDESRYDGEQETVCLVILQAASCGHREYMQTLDTSLSRILNRTNAHIWCGGILISLEQIPGDRYREFTLLMIDIAGRHELVQVVTEPTRPQGEKENTLDFLFTNNPILIHWVDIMPFLRLADHETVFMEISTVPRLNDISARTIRKYTKTDWSKNKNDMNKFTQQIAEETDSLSELEFWFEALTSTSHQCG